MHKKKKKKDNLTILSAHRYSAPTSLSVVSQLVLGNQMASIKGARS